jgi:hypothetical protein
MHLWGIVHQQWSDYMVNSDIQVRKQAAVQFMQPVIAVDDIKEKRL